MPDKKLIKRQKGSPQGKLTEDKKQQVVELLSQTGNLSACAASVGLRRETIYNAMKQDPGFSEQIALARDKACQAIESEMKRRGLEGINKDVYYQGEVVGKQKEYSDKLLLALAKANMPDRYSEKQHQIIDQRITFERDAKAKLANLLGVDIEEGQV